MSLTDKIRCIFGCLFPRFAIRVNFLRKTGRLPDLRHPRDLNEKIQWLKLHTDPGTWAALADKYRVREFVASRGLGDTLVPLLGKFDTVDEFAAAWEGLEAPFVIKANNSSKTVLTVRDKSSVNLQQICRTLSGWLSDRLFWGFYVEPHYKYIKPCIVVERFLEQTGLPAEDSGTLVDYKVWCFNGRPECIWACTNRRGRSVEVRTYSPEWVPVQGADKPTAHYRAMERELPAPECLQRMLDVASRLSEGFPEVRVDLYCTDGHVYFGEMTFSSNGGFMDFHTPEYLLKLGSMCELPEKVLNL